MIIKTEKEEKILINTEENTEEEEKIFVTIGFI